MLLVGGGPGGGGRAPVKPLGWQWGFINFAIADKKVEKLDLLD